VRVAVTAHAVTYVSNNKRFISILSSFLLNCRYTKNKISFQLNMSGHLCSGKREARKTACRSHSSIDYQCSETNVMHFLFNLLRMKGLYTFRALWAG
jgi:hypothetical protein